MLQDNIPHFVYNVTTRKTKNENQYIQITILQKTNI